MAKSAQPAGSNGANGAKSDGSDRDASRPALTSQQQRDAIWRASTSRQRFDLFRRYLKRQRKKDATDDIGSDHADGAASEPRRDRAVRRRYLGRYYRWLRPFFRSFALTSCAGLFVIAFEVFVPWATGRMLDVVIGLTNGHEEWRDYLPTFGSTEVAQWSGVRWLWTLALASLGAVLVSRAISLWRSLEISRLSARATQRLRSQLYDRLVRLPLEHLQQMKSGGVVSRLSTDVDQTVGLVQQAVLSPIQSVVQLLVVGAILVLISWQVTLVAALLLVVVASVYYGFIRGVRPIYRSMSEDRARIDGRVGETYGGIRVVRAFARETHEELEYGIGHHTTIRKQLWAHWIQQGLYMIWETLMPLTNVVIVGLGCYYVMQGTMVPGDVVIFMSMSWRVLQPVLNLVSSMTETQRSLASMERVYDVLERDVEKPDRPHAIVAPQHIDSLKLIDLGFAYGHESLDGSDRTPGDDPWVLHAVDVTIAGGSVVALVGPSGAGKTTFTDLLARYYDPSQGRIEVNGTDLRDYELATWRGRLAIVQQDTFLFDGSVRENIAYAKREATDEEIMNAAKQANAWEFIAELPEGLDAVIGERGVKLSGGQQQRLSIARAILADPALLILDEATSNLDTNSEQLIQAALERASAGRTTVVVAHRLSTIRNADLIVVIDEGRVVQQGTHTQLMAAGADSRYHDMVTRQQLDLN